MESESYLMEFVNNLVIFFIFITNAYSDIFCSIWYILEDGFQKQTMVEFQQCFPNHGMVLASKMKLNMHLQIKQLV